jgi:preprotein translocase subunit SecG
MHVCIIVEDVIVLNKAMVNKREASAIVLSLVLLSPISGYRLYRVFEGDGNNNFFASRSGFSPYAAKYISVLLVVFVPVVK